MPFGLRVLAGVYLTVGTCGAMLIKELTKERIAEIKKSHEDPHKQKEIFPTTAKMGFSSCVLYQVVFFTFVAAGYGGMLVPNIKNYGRLFITNDSVLTTIGALGAFGNGLFRIGWGTLMDKFPYRYVALINLVI